MSDHPARPTICDPELGVVALLCLAIVATRWQGFLLFHALAEVFSVVIGLTAFSIAWNARRQLDNPVLLLLGLAAAPVALLDLLHVLAYKGMPLFPDGGANLATQLWVAARLMETGAVVAVAVLGERRPSPRIVLALLATVLAGLLSSLFLVPVFPDCWREDGGLTPFKIGAEYTIVLLLAGSGLRLWWIRTRFIPAQWPYLAGALACFIAQELCFTLYTDVYHVLNMAGHILKILSFYLVYAGLVRFGFAEPQQTLYRNLAQLNTRLAVAALRHNELASLALSATGAAAWEWDMHAPEVLLTPHHAEWLGLPDPPTLSQFRSRLPVGQRERFDWLTAPRADGEARVGEFHLEGRASPPLRHIRMLTKVFSRADGAPPILIGCDLDITDVKTAQLERDNLLGALERSHAELRRFSEILAHHLQEPVRSQLRYTKALERALPPPMPAAAAAALDVIRAGGERLSLLLRDVQRYLSVESQPRGLSPCAADDALDLACRRLAGELAAVGATLERQPLPPVLIPRNHLTDLFVILLDNAAEYRDPARPLVIRIAGEDLEQDLQEPALPMAHIVISDTGIGIEAPYLERIFGLFERLYGPDEHPGTGIGLALARKIAESAGGRLWATSCPGQGSAFHILLPRVAEQDQAAQAVPYAQPRASQSRNGSAA